jgi:hypothetical protein
VTIVACRYLLRMFGEIELYFVQEVVLRLLWSIKKITYQ